MNTIVTDIVGRRFGRLEVVALIQPPKKRVDPKAPRCTWVDARCVCGNTLRAPHHEVTSGHVKSCGCAKRDALSQLRHGQTAGATSPEYRVWSSMMTRCYNRQSKSFHNYGGRGIGVCDRWRADFMAFFLSMGQRPSPDHSLDRVDVDRDYGPDNCRWATQTEQQRNRRDAIKLTIDGVTKHLFDWAAERGLAPKTVYQRIWRGWSVARSLEVNPVRAKRLVAAHRALAKTGVRRKPGGER